jgi:hypothetical protein
LDRRRGRARERQLARFERWVVHGVSKRLQIDVVVNAERRSKDPVDLLVLVRELRVQCGDLGLPRLDVQPLRLTLRCLLVSY